MFITDQGILDPPRRNPLSQYIEAKVCVSNHLIQMLLQSWCPGVPPNAMLCSAGWTACASDSDHASESASADGDTSESQRCIGLPAPAEHISGQIAKHVQSTPRPVPISLR